MVWKSTLQCLVLSLLLTISLDCARFGNKIKLNEIEVGSPTPGEWLDTFAMLTECTDAKFCNTTAQVPKVMHSFNQMLLNILSRVTR